jgi:uncharacterized protein YggL (DUF469 family)
MQSAHKSNTVFGDLQSSMIFNIKDTMNESTGITGDLTSMQELTDLKIVYNGLVYTGEEMQQIRCALLQKTWQLLQKMRPFD